MDYNRDTVKAWAGGSQFRALRADLARFRTHGYSGWGSEGFWALAIYRLQRSVHAIGNKYVRAVPALLLSVLRKIFVIVTGVDLNPLCEIGPGMLIPHGAQIENHRVHQDRRRLHDRAPRTIGAGSNSGERQDRGSCLYFVSRLHSRARRHRRRRDDRRQFVCYLQCSCRPHRDRRSGQILPTARDRRFGYSNVPMQKNVDSAQAEG